MFAQKSTLNLLSRTVRRFGSGYCSYFKDMGYEGFCAKIAPQLNYTREFVGLDQVNVHIPGGFHLESFDQRERKITLKSMYLLLDSAVTFAYFPIPYADRPSDSFLDIHKFHKDFLFFTVSSRVEVNQNFYKLSSPKYPLTITTRLSHMGKTSFYLTSDLLSPIQKEPYATFTFMTVIVDPKTRLPTPGPEWWREKYGKPSHQVTPTRMEPLQQPGNPECLLLRVAYSDTDDNCHTNWTTYIRACYDAFMDSALRKTYRHISEEEAHKGVKYLDITFKKESGIGDKLDVYSWETDKRENKELGFEIKKGSDVCCQAIMGFHQNEMKDDIVTSNL